MNTSLNNKSLKFFFSLNSDVKKLILSFFFGDENEIDSIRNQFYCTKNIDVIVLYFNKCYLTQWLCNTIVHKCPYKIADIPKEMITLNMSLKSDRKSVV